MSIIRADPSRPYDRQDDVALGEHPIDMASKIDTRRNVVDVAEHGLATEMSGRPVEDAAMSSESSRR